ncbi:hypothetical protein [Bradyrhizobium sp. CCBAU 11361]|uniref:hypothetical protein n=1 Tax=Bradyrhizobium sp. CCBAU 11361 TaxID=1630812 RepID=UPI003FA4324C
MLIALTRWVRPRLRAALWRQWKTPRRRCAALIANGVSEWAEGTRPAAAAVLGISPALYWALKCILQIARPDIIVPIVLAQLLEPPCTDPFATSCGRGGAARLPPTPINNCARSLESARGLLTAWRYEIAAAEHTGYGRGECPVVLPDPAQLYRARYRCRCSSVARSNSAVSRADLTEESGDRGPVDHDGPSSGRQQARNPVARSYSLVLLLRDPVAGDGVKARRKTRARRLPDSESRARGPGPRQTAQLVGRAEARMRGRIRAALSRRCVLCHGRAPVEPTRGGCAGDAGSPLTQ